MILGSTLLYAKYDDSFRNQLNDYLPFINSLLGEETKSSLTPPADDSFLKKRLPTANKVPDIAKQVPVPIEKPKEVKDSAQQTNAAVEKKDEIKTAEAQQDKETKPVVNEEEIKKKIKQSLESLMKEDNSSNSQLGEKDHESEIRAQLKRQLYVINDYFQEQIILYKTELNRRSELDMKDKVTTEKEAIANDFEQSFRKLKQMESLLKGNPTF